MSKEWQSGQSTAYYPQVNRQNRKSDGGWLLGGGTTQVSEAPIQALWIGEVGVRVTIGRYVLLRGGGLSSELLVELCAKLDLVHVVDPMQTGTVTPEQTYYRLHGTHPIAARPHRR